MKNEISEEMLDPELLKLGLVKLNEALSYFDDMTSFEGRNLASSTYIILTYGENITEFTG